jgi:hypothetical protein
MTMQVLAVNVEVQCCDGTRRIYLAADGNEIEGVEEMKKCLAVVPPMILTKALHRCKECES